MTLPGPVAGIFDVHLADGSKADDSCPQGMLWAARTAIELYRPDVIVYGGDFADGWLSPWDIIIETHARDLDELDRLHAESNVPAVVLKGNHENGPAALLVSKLRRVMPRCQMSGHDSEVYWGGWTILHGHQFDPWCKGPMQYVAEIGAVIGGVLERITGVEDSALNPSRITSPARAKRASMQTAIHEAADDYVRTHGGRVLHGHTHRRRISSDRRVVCGGTCTHNRGEFAVVWADGNAVIHETEGVF